MKKLIILAVAALGATAMTSCGMGNAKMKVDTDSLAYAIGVDVGNGIFQFDSTLNPELIAAGIRDVFNKKNKMTHEEAIAFIQEYTTVGLARKNLASGKKFIADAVKDGADTLTTGLAYKIHEKGNERKAAVGDSVAVHYTLTTPEGTQIDASPEGETRTFHLQAPFLIPAWLQGVPLVGEGGKITLYVPASLAYGDQGNRGIRPNQALKFEIEVVKVIPGPKVDSTTTTTTPVVR